MAVDAEILPVGAIWRIVHVVSVLVVNRQEVSVLVVELSSALRTDETMDLKGTFPVVTMGRSGLLQLL